MRLRSWKIKETEWRSPIYFSWPKHAAFVPRLFLQLVTSSSSVCTSRSLLPLPQKNSSWCEQFDSGENYSVRVNLPQKPPTGCRSATFSSSGVEARVPIYWFILIIRIKSKVQKWKTVGKRSVWEWWFVEHKKKSAIVSSCHHLRKCQDFLFITLKKYLETMIFFSKILEKKVENPPSYGQLR